MGLLNLIGFSTSKSETSPPKRVVPRQLPSLLCRDPRADKLVRTGGYCNILSDIHEWMPDAIAAATRALEHEMVFIPLGRLELRDFGVFPDDEIDQRVQQVTEQPFFIDRHLVTNEQFKNFINADGYRTKEVWLDEAEPFMPYLIDTTGVPAPAGWQGGNFDPSKASHPVVGISWFEADAYARWAGKRLPTTTQWQRAGTWWKPKTIFPWGGDQFERDHVNTFGSGHEDTVSVDDYATSATVHGVSQLIGNVWEWIDTYFHEIEVDGQMAELAEPIAEIRGGAFDTYLPSQSTCVFRSGQPMLARNSNVGFRCVASYELLAVMTSDSDR